MASPDRGMAEEVWLPMLNTSTMPRLLAITYARAPSCETSNCLGTKFPWPRLKEVGIPGLTVGEQPAGVVATRKRSSPGGSTAKTLAIVVAFAIPGSAKPGRSLANAFRNDGVPGRMTLELNTELRPHVLQAVTEEVVEPPPTKAKAPSGKNDTLLAGAPGASAMVFSESCLEYTYKLGPATMKAFKLSGE